jgi:aryl-alcohol dehydrogenase-like predicted oxidoreductase
MTFGEDHGWGASPDESEDILSEYLDLGGNFIDTANIYTNGHSEKIIGDFFAKRTAQRDRTVFGTKFYGNLYPGDPNGGGAGRRAIVQQLEQSLRRLQMDHVDIYWLHNWDRTAPIEETMRALDDIVTSGKARYIGFSDIPAWKTAEAQTLAHFRGWAPIIAMQLEYSLLERTAEGDLIPMVQDHGIAAMPWSPLAGGYLSGKWSRGNAGSVDTKRAWQTGPTESQYLVIDELNAVAAAVEAQPAQVALAWIQSRPGVTSTLLGARRIDQLRMNLGALDVQLTRGQIERLDEVSKPKLNFPAENNRDFAPMVGFAGATVDGRPTVVPPLLQMNSTRY